MTHKHLKYQFTFSFIVIIFTCLILIGCKSNEKDKNDNEKYETVESNSTTTINSNLFIVSDFSNRLEKIDSKFDEQLINKAHSIFFKNCRKNPFPYFNKFKYGFLNSESYIYYLENQEADKVLEFPQQSVHFNESNIHNDYFVTLNYYQNNLENSFSRTINNFYRKNRPKGGADVFNFFNVQLDPYTNFPKSQKLKKDKSEIQIHNFKNTVILFTDGFLEYGDLKNFQFSRTTVNQIKQEFKKAATKSEARTNNPANREEILEELFPRFKIRPCISLQESFKKYKTANPSNKSQVILCNVKGIESKPISGLNTYEIDEESIIKFFWKKWLTESGFDEVHVFSFTDLQTGKGISEFENLLY